ncbi:MAG: hypothetical protein NDJ24_07220 [Alphaproteobacteria bacterium]|nr:hypothetical protein [Alphaproteobacteria bacterium]
MFLRLCCTVVLMGFVWLGGGSTTALANTQFSGAYLLHVCEMDGAGKEKVKGGHTACQSYISGVIDYHRILQSMKLAPKIDICVPTKTPITDVHRTVLAYLRKHKENDAFIAAPAVTMALYKSYPCRQK